MQSKAARKIIGTGTSPACFHLPAQASAHGYSRTPVLSTTDYRDTWPSPGGRPHHTRAITPSNTGSAETIGGVVQSGGRREAVEQVAMRPVHAAGVER